MADWRFLTGWSGGELRDQLSRLRALDLNFRTPDSAMTRARGWNHDRIGACLGHEPRGAPLPDGIFEGARLALQNFEFSDPRIVTVYLDLDTPLVGRDILLEIKALGLRYLCGVRVTDVDLRETGRRTIFTLRLATLDGHIERGTERFRLFKDHRDGAVRFRLAARWRPGQFPNWWSRVGFHAVNYFYRTTWHRHLRDRLRRAGRAGAEGAG